MSVVHSSFIGRPVSENSPEARPASVLESKNRMWIRCIKPQVLSGEGVEGSAKAEGNTTTQVPPL